MNPDQPTVMVVDDDFALADSLRMLLKASGYTCHVHGDAASLLRTLKLDAQALNAPGCLVCDIRMPGMSGLDLFQQLRSEYPRMCWPVVFITGHADVQIAVQTLTQGAFDFLQKPFEPQLLLETVARAVARSRTNSDNVLFLQDYELRYESLTRQERSIMALILENHTNKAIAESLQNSVRTVEIHRSNVYRKMGVDSGIALSRMGERYRLLRAPM